MMCKFVKYEKFKIKQTITTDKIVPIIISDAKVQDIDNWKIAELKDQYMKQNGSSKI